MVEDLCWDPKGERLVVLLRAPHPCAGLLAVYATTYDPVVHARLLGFARPPAGLEGALGGARSLAPAPGYARGALATVRLGDRALWSLPMLL